MPATLAQTARSPLRRRPAAAAGLFYPADPQALRTALGEMLAQARAAVAAEGDAPPAAPPKLLVVPHAGYLYSGAVAASAYARLAPWRERIRRVVLLGPTHRMALRGLALPRAEVFETPLGPLPVDAAARRALAGLPQVVTDEAVHAQEHALEVQLPFLQEVLADGFTVLPLAVGRATPREVAAVLERLWGGDETLIVVSSDLSHYHAGDEARRLDADTVQRLLRLESSLDHDQACGATSLNGALRVARAHGLRPELLDLRHSGDTAGDARRVVGYAALAFVPGPQPAAPAMPCAAAGFQGLG